MTSDTYVADGDFQRDADCITTRVTADGSDGFPVERPLPPHRRQGVPVGEPSDHRPPPARPRAGACCRWASPVRDFGDTIDFDHIKRHYYCVH